MGSAPGFLAHGHETPTDPGHLRFNASADEDRPIPARFESLGAARWGQSAVARSVAQAVGVREQVTDRLGASMAGGKTTDRDDLEDRSSRRRTQLSLATDIAISGLTPLPSPSVILCLITLFSCVQLQATEFEQKATKRTKSRSSPACAAAAGRPLPSLASLTSVQKIWAQSSSFSPF